jgi:ribonuclease D
MSGQKSPTPNITLHRGDLPAEVGFGPSVAIDTETLGLDPHRDRLCLVQLSAGDGSAHLVQFAPGEFHFGRFDIAMLKRYLGVVAAPVYCTKIASRLVRTYTDRHGLKDLCRDLLGIELAKEQQSSDWGAPSLSPEQLRYAAADVLHLHALKAKLDGMLEREGRAALARACFDFLPVRAELDLAGWAQQDIFEH